MTLKNVSSGKHWWKNLLTSVQPKHCTTKYNPNLVEKKINKCACVYQGEEFVLTGIRVLLRGEMIFF